MITSTSSREGATFCRAGSRSSTASPRKKRKSSSRNGRSACWKTPNRAIPHCARPPDNNTGDPMNHALKQSLCRFLAVALMLLPYQTGQASMITTDVATQPASVQADRNQISSFLTRAQTVSELHALGLDPQVAQDRVAAMTDAEVSSLAGKINALPAGGEGLILILLLVLIIYLIVAHR